MKLAVLFSGGKDSVYAWHLARQYHEISALVTVDSANKESYMFHTPNISMASMQAEAAEIPLILQHTGGEKELEINDLKNAIQKAIDKYQIGGVVTGAIESVYQASRVQKVCDSLGLWCFNPLWKMDQIDLLEDIVNLGFHAIISGVFAYPLDEQFLGKRIDQGFIDYMFELGGEYGINPAGEGGEIETTVLDAPFFKSRINVKKDLVDYAHNSGTYSILEAELERK